MKYRLLPLIGFILLQLASPAQEKIRLNNDWEFLKQDLGGIWEAVRPVGKGNPESLPVWKQVNLPNCVNADDAVDPDVNYYQGPAWYRTTLNIQNPFANGRTLLHFEGAGQKTDVYIYTTKVGLHVGGYDEWTVDITDAVTAFKETEVCKKQFKGKIPLSIRTDNSRDLEMIPSSLSDFNLYGGIYRYLNLVYEPSLSIDKLFAFASVDKEGKLGKLNIKTRLYNPSNNSKANVSIKVMAPDGKIIQQTEKELNSLEGDININDFIVKQPKLWSPDHPVLYTVTTTVSTVGGSSIRSVEVAFRNFEFTEKGPFMLNGQRLLLKGTQRHEDHAGVAAAMTEEMMRTEMSMIKEMGVNFIRLAHYQQSPIILDLCDSLGIMVWEEIPWCRGGLGGDIYKAQARRMLTNMIEQHYDHPSIIIWGLGNENDWPGDFKQFDSAGIRNFMKELNALSHQLDASRKTAIRRCDFSKDIVDVYSPSLWAGWYRGIYTDYRQLTEKEFNGVNHFLHIEWGGDSHANRHSESTDKELQQLKTGSSLNDSILFRSVAKTSKNNDWSENYICNLFDWHLKEQETMPWLAGSAQWVFKDFSTPLRSDNPVPYMNQKGLVERDFSKKEAYYVFQSYWSQQPMVHIYGHSWPVRWGDEGEEKMVKVYSNCDEAELFVNGKSLGLKKRNSQDFPAAGLRWNVHFNTGINQLKVIAKKDKVVVQDTISFQYQTEKWNKPSMMKMEKLSEENGIATIQVKLLDDKGVPCLDAANFVRFGLAGDGKLMDNQGTTTGSRYVQMYNGRAVISIQLNGGKSVASVKADGIPTVFLNL